MNERERYLETMLFGNPDRVPLTPGGGRESTRARWYKEGLPEDVKDIGWYAYKLAGGTLPPPESGPGFPIQERMNPMFEEKVLEEKSTSRVVQDWKGNVCEISNEYTTEYLRNAIDFVTRRWINCPVENWDDWEEMKKRYDPEAPDRLPDNAEQLGKELQNRKHRITMHFSGPFWQIREWIGFENLCMWFYDKPDLIQDMVEFWGDYILWLMQRGFEYVVPDCFHISEDMAYKKFSMISPEMARQFLLPVWKKWGEAARKAGVPIYAVDSDGYIGELIPLWIEAGVNSCDPIEVAAGNDIVKMREEFGKDMAFFGSIDKRAMAKGGKAIEDEIARVQPVIDDGGFIPSCDHGVPSDVSWPDYCHYVKLLAKATGWL